MAGRARAISWAEVRREAERVTTSMSELGYYGIKRLVNDVQKLLVDSDNNEIGGLKYLFDEELNGSSLDDYWRNYYTARDRASLVQEQVRVTQVQEQVKQEQGALRDEVPAVARLARDRDLLVQVKQERDVLTDEIARERDLLVQVKQEHDTLTHETPVARLARDRDMLVTVKREQHTLTDGIPVARLARDRASLVQVKRVKREHKDGIPVARLARGRASLVQVKQVKREHTDAIPVAILALKTALKGFKRTKLATVKGLIDVFALQMFRYWGGQPITFKFSTSSTGGEILPAMSALRPLFDAAGIQREFDQRFTMTREGVITNADPYP